jgi:hypothetical protein
MRHYVSNNLPHGQGLSVSELRCLFRLTHSEEILVLTLVLRLGELDDNIGNVIPRVVDADEQEQNRSRSDAEQCRRRIAREHNRRDDECCVGDERKERMP